MLKKIILAAPLILSISTPCLADFNSQMNKMFGSMTNVTAPTSYMDQSRGVISGGRVTVKNKIVPTQFASFQPPRIDSGCGGIDWHVGSISFISADEFVQAMRSIGANAVGYTFKLALSNLCPSCAAIMEDLRKAMAAMNSLASDSCQAAQGLLGVAGINEDSFLKGNHLEKMAETVRTELGGTQGALSWIDRITPQKSPSKELDLSDQEKMIGNVAWTVINKKASNGAKLTDSLVDGTRDMAQTIMSLTGTVIVSIGDDEKSTYNVIPVEPTITLRTLMGEPNKNSTITQLTCKSTGGEIYEQCLEVVPVEGVSIEPMIKKVRRILLGTNELAIDGLVGKFVDNSDALTAEEKAFMELSPLHSKRIRDLSIFGPRAAKIYAENAAEKIALDLTSELVFDLIKEVRTFASVSDKKIISDYLSRLEARVKELRAEELKITQSIQTDEAVSMLFDNLLKATDRSQYAKIASDIIMQEKKLKEGK
ncbi:MAG: conjugal transfer protein TraH [Desulfuromonas thiophila]|jgi:conjugative transfer pilus assembly protein TraH|nr:conjugal transfer protein TraH [Desulfuromonas thiophila]MDY0251353.1 conjugal transfer protein TraH [Pseudomonas sp.]